MYPPVPLVFTSTQGDGLPWNHVASPAQPAGDHRDIAGASLGSEKHLEMRSNFILLFFLPYPTILSITWTFSSEKTELTISLIFSFLFCSSITRTFASGKTEKVIFQALKELGLPSGKVFIDLLMCF